MSENKPEKPLENLRDVMAETDRLFITSPKLIEKYKEFLKEKLIEIDGMKWPIDTLVASTINEMKVFYAKNIGGWWPPDSAVVVVASNEVEARVLLEQELEKSDIPSINPGTGNPYVLHQIDLSKSSIVVLGDGNVVASL